MLRRGWSVADLNKICALLDATAGHTPGPWFVLGGDALTADHETSLLALDVDGMAVVDRPQDATLMAAAPDLRAALAEAVEEIATLRAARAGGPITMADAIRACMERARKEREP